MALCEGGAGSYPPGSYYLIAKAHTGETCGSVFWIFFNQRFHLLYPDMEKYVSEIEKSIYNIGLANQVKGKGIRYHTRMEGRKDAPTMINTCCEGQGARLYGALPEFIYSLAPDGLYVDLFEPSTIEWEQNGQAIHLKMATEFPRGRDVSLTMAAAKPAAIKIRVRVPSWAITAMPILVNGKRVAMGHPGAYAVLNRTWNNDDKITFMLPMDFRLTRYTGFDQIPGHERYALEYGPFLLAAVGPLDQKFGIQLLQAPQALHDWLKPKPGQPLHFTIAGQPEYEYMPYWQVENQTFTCFPIIEPIAVKGAAEFLQSTTVKIVSKIPDAQIHYTVDGSEPTDQSPVYSQPFEVSETVDVKARAFSGKEARSPVVASTFQRLPLFPPTINRRPGTQLIEMRLPQLFPEAAIYYTLDGNEPTEQSPRYADPFAPPVAKGTIRARAIVPGHSSSATVQFVVGSEASYPWPVPDVHLSDLVPLKATTGWNTTQTNVSIIGRPPMLADSIYDKGLSVHAESELVYSLQPEYKRFVALVGIDDNTPGNGKVKFEVYLDQDLVYQTPLLSARQTWHINVQIRSGSQRLGLVVTDGEHNWAGAIPRKLDRGDWVQAGFRWDDQM
jgi:hypothetical protein